MKHLESILGFIISLARIIFPAKKRVPSTCPDPFPDGRRPHIPADEANGSDAERHRSDPGTLQPPGFPPQARHDYLGLAGYSLMIAGSMGCLIKWLF